MLIQTIEFIRDFLTHLSRRKIIGAILVLVGLAVVQEIRSTQSPNAGVFYMLIGLLISGAGSVLIYYDMAKNKNGTQQSDLELLAKAYEQKPPAAKTPSGWHMNDSNSQETDSTNPKHPST